MVIRSPVDRGERVRNHNSDPTAAPDPIRWHLLPLAILGGAVAAGGVIAWYRQTATPTPLALTTKTPPVRADARPAFPGADGHGRMAQGGRGGRVIAVTNRNDAGPGSLRACLEAHGPRVCVFRVGGLIRYTTLRPIIRNPYLTVAGETAPGGGILIAHSGGKDGFTPFVIKGTHDVVVRHIRVRADRDGEQTRANSSFVIEDSKRVILDHVSSSWSLDENFGGQGQNDAITVSWSILAEGVPRHDKCALLSSDPKAAQSLSFVRNLCAHNGDRNPDVNFMPGSCVEVVNNVIYNAQSQFTEVWESYGGTPVSIVGNYYRRGPSTPRRAIAIDRQRIASRGNARIYQRDNLFDGAGLEMAPTAQAVLASSPACPLAVTAHPPGVAYRSVIAQAGAFPRDSVDVRIVQEVMARTGAIGRKNRILPDIADAAAYADGDGDGMSDAWETANRSDPQTANAWDDADGDGWANLENFLDYAHRARIAGQAPR